MGGFAWLHCWDVYIQTFEHLPHTPPKYLNASFTFLNLFLVPGIQDLDRPSASSRIAAAVWAEWPVFRRQQDSEHGATTEVNIGAPDRWVKGNALFPWLLTTRLVNLYSGRLKLFRHGVSQVFWASKCDQITLTTGAWNAKTNGVIYWREGKRLSKTDSTTT